MVHTEASATIQKPTAEVFAYITDPSKEGTWHTDVAEAKRLTSGPIGLGSRTAYVFPFMGRRHRTVGEVTAFEPGRLERISLDSGPMGMRPTVTLRFESLGSATRFTRVVDIEPSGIAKLFAPMMGRMVAGRNARFVENARRQLEEH